MKAASSEARKAAAAATEELFNIPSDPAETRDVAAEHPDLVAKMKTIMAEQHAPSADFPMKGVDK